MHKLLVTLTRKNVIEIPLKIYQLSKFLHPRWCPVLVSYQITMRKARKHQNQVATAFPNIRQRMHISNNYVYVHTLYVDVETHVILYGQCTEK